MTEAQLAEIKKLAKYFKDQDNLFEAQLTQFITRLSSETPYPWVLSGPVIGKDYFLRWLFGYTGWYDARPEWMRLVTTTDALYPEAHPDWLCCLTFINWDYAIVCDPNIIFPASEL
jgi:hypothetical protein